MAMELGSRPEQLRLMTDRPELIANAIEETLRYHPIVWAGCRTALRDADIGDQTIHEGDYISMVYASADRDEEVWGDTADEFDVTRPFGNDHLGFGHGEHSCPGALLARTVSRVIWERLLTRFPHFVSAGEPKRNHSPFAQSMASVPLTFFP
jgi:cytochrome P450